MTTGRRSQSQVGLLQVCAAGVLWGTGGLVVTLLHDRDGLGAMTASAWRTLLAAVTLVAFAGLTSRWPGVRRTFRSHPRLVVLVGCGTATYQAAYFVAVLWVGVSIATVVALGLAPVLAAMGEHLRAGTRPGAREVMVLAAALTGLALISGQATSASGPRPVAGLLLAVLAGGVYAATTVLGHGLVQRVDSMTLTVCSTTVSGVVLAPFLLLAAARSEPLLPGSPGSWVLLLYLGVATMALAYALLYAGLRTTSGSAATVATLLEPLSAAALAAVILGEPLTAAVIAGGALILVAVVALRPDDTRPTPV